MQFPYYTFLLDLCRLVILIYVTIDEFSYDINVIVMLLVNWKFLRLIRLFIRCNICGLSGRLLKK